MDYRGVGQRGVGLMGRQTFGVSDQVDAGLMRRRNNGADPSVTSSHLSRLELLQLCIISVCYKLAKYAQEPTKQTATQL